MKFFIFLILVCVLALSCKKEYCWKCHSTEVVRWSTGAGQSFSNDTALCKKTDSEIKQYEKDGTYTRNDASQGLTIVSVTSCTQQ